MKKAFQMVLLAGVFAAGTVSAKAQEVPRWELGPMFNLIKIQQFDSNRFFGFGARGVLNFSDVLGADVQFTRNTHNESFAPSDSHTVYSHRAETLGTVVHGGSSTCPGACPGSPSWRHAA